MGEIFQQIKDEQISVIRNWLDTLENDLNLCDSHGFSLLHWAAFRGRTDVVELLLHRGVRINSQTITGDTPLHFAVSKGNIEIVIRLIKAGASVNARNDLGNTPLHYSTFWNYETISQELVCNGALINLENNYGVSPMDGAPVALFDILSQLALNFGQTQERIRQPPEPRRNLSVHNPSLHAPRVELSALQLRELLVKGGIGGDVWTASWAARPGLSEPQAQEADLVVKLFRVGDWTPRLSREFADEARRLRILNHANVLPVLAIVNERPTLAMVAQRMRFGSLFDVLHRDRTSADETLLQLLDAPDRAVRWALDICRGMTYLHALELHPSPLLHYHLCSPHVMIDEDLVARISLFDYKFSFYQRSKLYVPAWLAPEALTRRASAINLQAAHIWSFGVLLWELETRVVPFDEYSPMETGLKIAVEGLRLSQPEGFSARTGRLMQLCQAEEAGRRPRFDQLLPILEKMCSAALALRRNLSSPPPSSRSPAAHMSRPPSSPNAPAPQPDLSAAPEDENPWLTPQAHEFAASD